MRTLAASIAAQVRAEVTTRLRSASTLVALAVMLGTSYLCIPDPAGKVSSLAWKTPEGVVQAPVYDASYLGLASAILAGVFLLVAAFYVVAGAVRRDRESRVGAVLAATPLSKLAYLAGKAAAGAAYLAVLSAMAIPIGLLAFLRWGQGPFRPAAFVLPWLLILPGTAFVAAMAVLWDVTPGLRGRAGLVIWFFSGMLLMTALPMQLSGGVERRQSAALPFFDPTGMITLQRLIGRSLPAGLTNVSTGITIRETRPQRVPWAGLALSPGMVLLRLTSTVWALVPLLLAVPLFDRFDPSRGSLRLRRTRLGDGPQAAPSIPAAVAASAEPPIAPALHVSQLVAVSPAPSAWRSVVAEARLLWDTASWLKWPLLAASLGAALAPAEAARGLAAAFLLLLIPVLSEAAAREDMSGTRGLVFSQPGVPASPALWKLAAACLFLGAVTAPPLLRALASPARLFALVTGLVFLAAFATGAGLLTGGGKLFSGLGLALWYACINGLPAADATGLLGGGLGPVTRAAYLAAAAAWIGAALAVERRRARGT